MMDLQRAVNWPTPTCSDATGGQCPADKVPETRQGSQLLKEITKGLLSPRWVEALMGWPLNFLGLELPGFGRRAEDKNKKPGSRTEPADGPLSGDNS